MYGHIVRNIFQMSLVNTNNLPAFPLTKAIIRIRGPVRECALSTRFLFTFIPCKWGQTFALAVNSLPRPFTLPNAKSRYTTSGIFSKVLFIFCRKPGKNV